MQSKDMTELAVNTLGVVALRKYEEDINAKDIISFMVSDAVYLMYLRDKINPMLPVVGTDTQSVLIQKALSEIVGVGAVYFGVKKYVASQEISIMEVVKTIVASTATNELYNYAMKK